jgi:hypothetical protein
MAPSGPPALPTTHCPLHPPGQCVSHPCHPCPYPWPFAPTLPKQQSRPGLCRSHLRPADRVWPHAYRCAASAKLSLHAGSCTCLERDQACILAASGGPRLKSLDLPKSLYIHTYIHTHTRTCSCAESAWPLSCPVLSCFTPHAKKALFAASTTTPAVCPALPCPACTALQRTTLHYIALCCTVGRLHSPCVLPCTIALPPTRASFSVANSPTARKRYRAHRARSCPLSRISGHLPTNPARRRASK